MKERPNRSDSFQYLWNEINQIEDKVWDNFKSEKIIQLNDHEKDKLYSIDDEIGEILIVKIIEVLTPNQWKIVKLLGQGLTQWEIANLFGINQSSVQKCINGNADYSRNKIKKFGGVRKKAMGMIYTLKEVKPLMIQIDATDWTPVQCYLPYYETIANSISTLTNFQDWLYDVE